jgi:hypothetical protein
VQQREATKTAWQIDATLREFPGFNPINVWFEYPIHRIDETDVLKDVKPEEEKPYWQRGKETRQKKAKENKVKKHDEFVTAFTNLELNGDPVKLNVLAEALHVTGATVGGWVGNKKMYGLAEEFESYKGDDGIQYIRRKSSTTPTE